MEDDLWRKSGGDLLKGLLANVEVMQRRSSVEILA
jgi:hypothetical protein